LTVLALRSADLLEVGFARKNPVTRLLALLLLCRFSGGSVTNTSPT